MTVINSLLYFLKIVNEFDQIISTVEIFPDDSDLSVSRTDLSRSEQILPEWVTLGESVHIRLTNSTGVVAYIGPAHFAPGIWIGVELDTPTGIHFVL